MHRSTNLSVHGYSVAKPRQEHVSLKPGQTPKATAQPPARLEQQAVDYMWLDPTEDLWVKPNLDLNILVCCTFPRRRSEILVSNVYSCSRVLGII